MPAPVQLLTKPPFRFLHDVISAVITATGFAEGLLDEEQKDSGECTTQRATATTAAARFELTLLALPSPGTIKDKQSKLDFLDKVMTCVGICLGEEVDCKAAKVIAGLEPEKTNRFLQVRVLRSFYYYCAPTAATLLLSLLRAPPATGYYSRHATHYYNALTFSSSPQLLAKVASNPDSDSADAVQRTLQGEQPDASRPARKGGEAKGGEGAKDDGPAEPEAKGAADSKAPDDGAVLEDDERRAMVAEAKQAAVPASRSGGTRAPTRGGAKGENPDDGSKPRTGGMDFAPTPSGLDAEIEACTWRRRRPRPPPPPPSAAPATPADSPCPPPPPSLPEQAPETRSAPRRCSRRSSRSPS